MGSQKETNSTLILNYEEWEIDEINEMVIKWIIVRSVKNTDKQMHEKKKSVHHMGKKFCKEMEILMKTQTEILENKI